MRSYAECRFLRLSANFNRYLFFCWFVFVQAVDNFKAFIFPARFLSILFESRKLPELDKRSYAHLLLKFFFEDGFAL